MADSTVVAFLGPLGTFSHQVTLREFGQQVNLLPCETITAVFDFLLACDNATSYGIVPISNSSNGPVKETRDYLSRHMEKFQKIGQVELKATHYPARRRGAQGPIGLITSHEQALGQCRKYLAENYPSVSQKSVDSTAMAAQQASQEPSILAICSQTASELYNLEILDHGAENCGVQDAGTLNETTFYIFQRAIKPK